jgi:two-component response regulator family protein
MKVVNFNVKNLEIPAVFESSKKLPVVNLKLIFKVAGSCSDEINGTAKFVAKMFDEGTLSKGATVFAKELETRAISLYAVASYETFSFEINCLKEYFDFAKCKLKELLDEPNLSDESLKKVKTLTLGEILSNESDYDYLAKIELNKLLYQNTNLANPGIGTKESIEKINLDVIKKFIKDRLNLSNLFIVFGGDIREDELDLNDILGNLQVGEKRQIMPLSTSEAMKQNKILKPSQQAYIYFGSPFGVGINERFKAKVASFILGEGGFGSRLMEQIRVRRGLAYSVYSYASFTHSFSQMTGYLQTKNESKDEAILVVKEQFEKFVQNGVKSAELAQAKKFLLGSQPLNQETLFNRLNIAQGEFYNGFKLGNFKAELEKISKLTLSELNEFISRHEEITKLSFAIVYNEI